MKNKILAMLSCVAALMVFMSVFVKCTTEYSGGSEEERIKFIKRFGWHVRPGAIESINLTLPPEYDVVYKEYNKLQLAAGMDISSYMGREAIRYTYVIENHTKTVDGTARVNLLVCDGVIIAADVMVVNTDGFMHAINKREYVKN